MVSTDLSHPPHANAAAVPGLMSRDLQSAGSLTPWAAGVSRTDLARRIRAEHRNTYDEATHWGARALRTYSFIGCGFFMVCGLTAVSQTGFATVGKVYLVAAVAFALVFLLNLPRLYNQEQLYDNRRRLDSELARAVAAALAEGDNGLDVRAAA